MRISRNFSGDNKGISELASFVDEMLTKWKEDKIKKVKAVVAVEEAAGSLVAFMSDASGDDREVSIILKNRLGTITIELSAPGEAYSLAENMASANIDMESYVADDTRETIRNIMLRSLADGLKYKNRNGKNYIIMTLVRARHAFLLFTMGALVMGVIVGLIATGLLSPDINNVINSEVLVPIKDMYLSALKMVVAPVVFFSIISCIMQFSDISALGRIGAKVFGTYLFTTVVAAFVGIGAFNLFKPGNIALAEHVEANITSITTQHVDFSIKDMIMNIIPTNIIDPFQKSNMLQLIFMAILFGIATALLGKYAASLKILFKELNDLFLKVTTMIIKVMPIAVFCSMMSMMVTMGAESLISVLGIILTFLFGLVCMMAVYCLLMVVVGRLNPIPFIRKYAATMIQVFSMASSNAAIPLNMEACEKKIGIDKKIYTLSIPLGATVNMDGTCVHMAVFALALAKIYGVEITTGALVSMVISIIVLSIGAPGIPGSGLICLSVLLTQLGVPVEAIGLVMGIDSFIGMFRCMSNCLGDVAVSTIVAKSEGCLDMQVYRS
ncbi:MAG: dicarboxylate/amino acid:cation symporter [Lachnospiraceae bacterium]|nr:dicarboxylate/amino acid:cation symporter [Lachnospiraceae bacterium]